MEAAAVSAAHGAMGSLLGKLGDLLTDKYKLLKEAEREVRSLKSELDSMHAFLKDMAISTECHNEQAKCWAKEVRELSYDIEDSVDDFMLRVAEAEHESSNSKPQGFNFKGFISRCLGLLTTIGARHQVAGEFRGLKRRVVEVSERRTRYRLDDDDGVSSRMNDTAVDPRMVALYTEAARLVGIDGPRDELVRLMMGEEDDAGSVQAQHHLKVISIVGFGGLGKTTLANEIYRKLEGKFDCQSFVPVSQKPNIRKVLKKMLSQIGGMNDNMELWDEDALINELRIFLANRRYFIVIDDIWDAKTWSILRCALPESENGCRVITTTRIETVAMACCSDKKYVYKMKSLGNEDSKILFLKRIFGSHDACPSNLEEVSTGILKRCGGLPLAIITVSSYLATQPNKLMKEQWEQTLNSLGSNLEINPTLEGMRQILSLSYTNLPHCLKTCALYLGIYPEDHTISKNDLVRQWVAQGFISKAPRQDREDIAAGYFNELVNRSIIQPADTNIIGDVLSCRVHDMMLDLILYKCREENFITAVDHIQDIEGTDDKVRRLSLNLDGVVDGATHRTIQLSQVRALARFGTSTYIPQLLEFKHVRVLNLEIASGNHGRVAIDLTGICCLFQLRYLKFTSCHKIKLPSKIRGLQQLETLEIEGYKVEVPPDVVHLRLLHLIVDGGITLPNGIANMKSLRTLRCFQLCTNSADTIREIGDLTNLRDLRVRFNRQRRPDPDGAEAAAQRIDALRSSLEKLCGLRHLHMSHDGSLDELSSLSSSSATPRLLERLLTESGCFTRVPRWIGELHNLYDLQILVKDLLEDDLRILAQLPSLVNLSLCIRRTPQENLVITRTGFFVLTHFQIGCSRISSLVIQVGAMPRLQRLELGFNASGWVESHGAAPSGIEHLPCLKEISVEIGGRGAKESNRRAALSALMNAADQHPGRPVANIRCIDDMWVIFDDFVMEEAQEIVCLSP